MNADLILWLLVGVATLSNIVSLGKPKSPEAPAWVRGWLSALAFPLIGLWVAAAWVTGYWQLAAMPAIALLTVVTGAVAKAGAR